jgi:hypothetical protein
LSAILREALSLPTKDGVNVTFAAHAAPGATSAPLHVFALTEKSAALLPVIVTPPEGKFRLELPVFATVIA